MFAAAVGIQAVAERHIGAVVLGDDRLTGIGQETGAGRGFARPFFGLVLEVLGIRNDNNRQEAVLGRQTAAASRTGSRQRIERKGGLGHEFTIVFDSILHKVGCASQDIEGFLSGRQKAACGSRRTGNGGFCLCEGVP